MRYLTSGRRTTVPLAGQPLSAAGLDEDPLPPVNNFEVGDMGSHLDK
jgi:hypothetical protein